MSDDMLIDAHAIPSDRRERVRDRCSLGVAIFYMQGVGALFPWNAFITPTDYYALRLAGSPFASSFESIFSISFTLCGLLTMILLRSLPEPSSLRTPIMSSQMVMVGAFAITAALTLRTLLRFDPHIDATLSAAANVQFAWLVTAVALCSVAVSVLLASLNRYAAVLGSSYIRALSGGQGIAGLAASLANLLRSFPEMARSCGAGAPDGARAAHAAQDGATVEGAALYFGGACVVLVLCLGSFLLLERLPFVREAFGRQDDARREFLRESFLRESAESAPPPSPAAVDADASGARGERVEREVSALENALDHPPPAHDALGGRGWRRVGGGGHALKRGSALCVERLRKLRPSAPLVPWAVAITLTYSVTIALFPALTSIIRPSPHGACEWRHLFTPLMFVVFNAGDTIGRNLTFQLHSARSVLLVVSLRVLFAPLFILCYVRAESTASADADAIPLLLMLAFSITNGWITTTVFIRASEDVGDAERGHAAGHIVLFLNTGLAIGAALSFVVHFAACGGCNPFVNPKQQHGLLI